MLPHSHLWPGAFPCPPSFPTSRHLRCQPCTHHSSMDPSFPLIIPSWPLTLGLWLGFILCASPDPHSHRGQSVPQGSVDCAASQEERTTAQVPRVPSLSTYRLPVLITKAHLLWEDQLETGTTPSAVYTSLIPGHIALPEEHKLHFRWPMPAGPAKRRLCITAQPGALLRPMPQRQHLRGLLFLLALVKNINGNIS